MPTPHILPNPRTGHANPNARADALVVGRGVEAAAVPQLRSEGVIIVIIPSCAPTFGPRPKTHTS